MSKLADFVIETAENFDDIRTWLESHEQFKPTNILDLDSSDSDKGDWEEVKVQTT